MRFNILFGSGIVVAACSLLAALGAPDALAATYKGCVRQLDASASGKWIQAIVNRDATNQQVVVAEDAKLQSLLETAFLWGTQIEIDYKEGTPQTLTRVKLDKFFTGDCKLGAPGTK